ncbi:MAG: hypothetical protein R2729_01150 [Bryobacteraceae bacterium]
MSKLVRRVHMYLALFLTPWILMYAASTFVMNHRPLFRGNPAPPPEWKTLSESPYTGEFAPGATPAQMAAQLLASLDLDGAHQARMRDGRLEINRQQAANPLRVTYTPETRAVRVEQAAFKAPEFLERMHRRRGYQHPYAIEDAWAFSVDLVIAAILFWVLSGLWMWWELKVTRLWGGLFALAGIGLFALFLSVI